MLALCVQGIKAVLCEQVDESGDMTQRRSKIMRNRIGKRLQFPLLSFDPFEQSCLRGVRFLKLSVGFQQFLGTVEHLCFKTHQASPLVFTKLFVFSLRPL